MRKFCNRTECTLVALCASCVRRNQKINGATYQRNVASSQAATKSERDECRALIDGFKMLGVE